MLALTAPYTFEHLPAVRFLREAVTPRTLLLLVLFAALTAGGFAASRLYAAVPSCVGEEYLLLYPMYDSRGTVTHTTLRCGARHRGCMPLAGHPDGAEFQCSPFMAPKPVH